MAWKNYKKYVLRKKKARRNERNRTLMFDHGANFNYCKEIPIARFKERRTRKTLNYETWEWEYEVVTYYPRRVDYEYLNRITEEEFWQMKDRYFAERLRDYQRCIDLSQWPHSRKGTKSYKEIYHRKRRSQSRQLCHYALVGDEERFESIPNCDYFKGAIGWDIW